MVLQKGAAMDLPVLGNSLFLEVTSHCQGKTKQNTSDSCPSQRWFLLEERYSWMVTRSWTITRVTTYWHFTMSCYEQFHISPSRIENFLLQSSRELHVSVSMCNRQLKLNSSKLAPEPVLHSPQVLATRGNGQPRSFSCSGHISGNHLWLLSPSCLTPRPLAQPLNFGGICPSRTTSTSALGQWPPPPTWSTSIASYLLPAPWQSPLHKITRVFIKTCDLQEIYLKNTSMIKLLKSLT